jgi:hypothetical protein
MKVNKGSFGIPPELEEMRAKQQMEAEAKSKSATPPPAEEIAEVRKDNEALLKDMEPLKILEKIGVVFSDKDFDMLLFKGYIEKEIIIIKDKLVVTYKTLTGEEYDLVDEILSEEIQATQMTKDGVETRRSMIILSMGCVKINTNPVVKNVLKEGSQEVDLKETSKLRRKTLGKMSPPILDEMARKYGILASGIRLLVNDPGPLLKN